MLFLNLERLMFERSRWSSTDYCINCLLRAARIRKRLSTRCCRYNDVVLVSTTRCDVRTVIYNDGVAQNVTNEVKSTRELVAIMKTMGHTLELY